MTLSDVPDQDILLSFYATDPQRFRRIEEGIERLLAELQMLRDDNRRLTLYLIREVAWRKITDLDHEALLRYYAEHPVAPPPRRKDIVTADDLDV